MHVLICTNGCWTSVLLIKVQQYTIYVRCSNVLSMFLVTVKLYSVCCVYICASLI